MNKKIYFLAACFSILLLSSYQPGYTQDNNRQAFAVIAYYSGDTSAIDNYPVRKLTHIIYSFLHLKGNKLAVDNTKDSLTIVKLVELKKHNPGLKVLLSLGGWGGCRTCSDVFSTREGREEFAVSVKDLLVQYHADGLDLDWEYPVLESVKGHSFSENDKANFTGLIRELRHMFGQNYELSFAAGGFNDYLIKSVEWNKVMPLVDWVNIMSYDYTNGNSTVTGHHTPLYSTPEQPESTDLAIQTLDSLGVPRSKMVIGAAFYGRMFENVENINHGLYQAGKFKAYINYRNFDQVFSPGSGFEFHFDSIAMAYYCYNPDKKLFATFDNKSSISEKTAYALKKHLGGIMFWELTGDTYENGLLDTIYSTIKQK